MSSKYYWVNREGTRYLRSISLLRASGIPDSLILSMDPYAWKNGIISSPYWRNDCSFSVDKRINSYLIPLEEMYLILQGYKLFRPDSNVNGIFEGWMYWRDSRKRSEFSWEALQRSIGYRWRGQCIAIRK